MSDAPEAKTAETSDAAAAGLAPKPSKLVPGVLVVNTLLLVGLLVKVLLFPPAAAPPADAEAKGKGEHEKKGEEHGGGGHAAPPGMGPTVRLPDFVVHLRNPEAERYARLSFELEVGVETEKERVTTQMPAIRELFIAYLSDRTVEDLRGSEGIDRAKKDLLTRLAQQVPGSPVRSIYVTDIVIQ
ncbi:MAG: flagellar basal body-associated FliL family protein [Myxococcaceae bacterium]|nr:flagellar basal body-associated FliL family protein [Myxococcaceae bacterium]